ncbi:MAG: hypothetical protein H6622_05790 [Halobacteriovoraceae bacterium]|nr:hypothetical protein [Halobacteriovoraceae bacterium]
MSEQTKNVNRLTFILYEGGHPPKYFSIEKRILRSIFFGLPTITILCIILVIGGSIYFKEIISMAEKKEPVIIEKLKTENQDLAAQINEVTLENTELKNKLNSSEVPDINILSIFRSIPGQVDKSKVPLLAIQDLEVPYTTEKVTLRFNLVNVTENNRVLTGYIYIIARIGNSIQIYPEDSFPQDDMQLIFNKGESFLTSRFRPVEANFIKTQDIVRVSFKVLIFSRTGDLIHKQIISKDVN